MKSTIDPLDAFLCDSNIESDSEPQARKDTSNRHAEHGKDMNVDCTRDRVDFFNPRDPQHLLQTEQPKHREVVILAMQGLDNKEVAERTGYSSPAVGYILKQPWAIEYMSQNMHNHGMERVETLLKGAVADAVERLITEMDNPKARSAERISAADKILDRVYGRAAQPIIHSKGIDASQNTDAEIEQRLALLRSRS